MGFCTYSNQASIQSADAVDGSSAGIPMPAASLRLQWISSLSGQTSHTPIIRARRMAALRMAR